jgi:hypothetical protein
MKAHIIKKISHLINGEEFYSEKHDDDNSYSLKPFSKNIYELHMNGEKQCNIYVCIVKNALVAIGNGDKSGHFKTIHLEDVQFDNLNFIGEDDFDGEKYNEEHQAYFDGEPVSLINGGLPQTTRLHIENNLL